VCAHKVTLSPLLGYSSITIASYSLIERLVLIYFSLAQQDQTLNEVVLLFLSVIFTRYSLQLYLDRTSRD